MTVSVPPQLEHVIQQKAAELQVTVDQVVQVALERYLQDNTDLQDELDAWQEVRDEAAHIVEESIQ